ncbi:phosphatase PAP2 family protein [Agrococcus sp. HG114]|uniref:phosphatase PAP2 family protein n=1 Tax=Agrococcus sp. HG114 TaxID=2969757 RepID=UPI00215AD2DB|nr:phosphatase PAP2 family protein [Agrococcus sp. HG114]MCR8671649.1 phosphatase PAP2 family protein [Agrococcus sp. HG114]
MTTRASDLKPFEAAWWRRKFVVEERYVERRERRALYAFAIALALVGAAIFGTMLISVLTGSGVALLDEPVMRWFVAARDDAETVTMTVLAFVFGPVAMPVIVAVVTAAWLLFATHAWRPLVLACGMALGVALALAIAPLVQHPRPPLDLMVLGADHTFSFPSGHVLGASDFLLITAYLVGSRDRQLGVRVGLLAIAAFGIVAQVFSRLYLGYHWLTDVLASVGLALMILALVVAVDTHRTVRVSGEPITGPLSTLQRDGT